MSLCPRRALPCRVGHRPPSQRKTSTCTNYFDWDRFDAEQGDEAEAAEQGGAAGGEQGGEA